MTIKKPFQKDEPLTFYAFSQLTGIGESTIGKHVKSGKLTVNADNKIVPSVFKNWNYLQKKIYSKKRLIHGNDQTRRDDQKIMRALMTGEVALPSPEIFDYKKMKLAQVYNVGWIDDGIFEPLISVGKYEGRDVEIDIIKNSYNITLSFSKNVLSGIFLDDDMISNLYMQLK